MIDTADPVEQEKHPKYNHLVANAAAVRNVIDLTRAIRELQTDGYIVGARTRPSSAPTRPGSSSALAMTPCR